MIIATLASRSNTTAPTFANGTTTHATPGSSSSTTAAAAAAPAPTNPSSRTLIITTAVLGGALVLLVLAIAMFFLLRRRRRQKATQQLYQEARARDPTLTWDDYIRRQKLTHSRLFLEEELQRDMMIRKSLQSRTSVNTTGAARPPLPPAALPKKPRRMRSRSWHAGQTLGGREEQPTPLQRPLPSADAPSRSPPEMLEEHREGFRQEWRDIEASLEQTWEILTGKRHPSLDDARAPLIRAGAPPHAHAAAAAADNNDDTASSTVPSRPPTIRLKTPPLFRIHPAFRRGSKHSSLPVQFQPPGAGGGVVS